MLNKQSDDELRRIVREKYNTLAAESDECCGPADCCASDMIGDAYDSVGGYESSADLKLGCGVPTEHAGLQPGQVVVDLGSGAGLDAFIARRTVGESGRVIGIDFSPEMLTKARRNAKDLGYENVEFIEGEIEDLPLPDDCADVVLSNCVLNLVPDKAQAFREIFRILRPGGHFTVSDIVTSGELSSIALKSASLYAGCVGGAMHETDYLSLIERTGFVNIDAPGRKHIDVPEEALKSGELLSITISASVPA